MTFDPMSVEVTCVTLPKDHCVQVPWQYINVCGYSDQFCKIPHTYTYIHTHTYYIQNEWSHSLLLNSVQARQKLKNKKPFVSRLPHAFVSLSVFDSVKFKLSFFPFFPQKYMLKDITNTTKHTGQQTSWTLYSALVFYLVQPKIKMHISHWTKVVTDSNLTLLLTIKLGRDLENKCMLYYCCLCVLLMHFQMRHCILLSLVCLCKGRHGHKSQ